MEIKINTEQEKLLQNINKLFKALEETKRIVKLIGETNDDYIETINKQINARCRLFIELILKNNVI